MNVFKRLGLALDAFRNVTDNQFYDTYYNTVGGFTFQNLDDDKYLSEGYAKNADLYSIVRKISTTASDIPLLLYKSNREDEKELVTSGQLYDLLQQPNRMQSINEFIDESMIYLLLNGNNYNAGYRGVGLDKTIKEINVLPSNYITIETGDLANIIKNYWYQEVSNIKFAPEDVMHVRYPNPAGDGADRLYGMSPIKAGSMALQASNNLWEADASILNNKGASGILSDQSERSMKPEQGEALQAKWDSKASGANKFGKVLVTSARLNYIQMGMSPADLQLIESGVIKLRTLCNLYSVPSQLFNDVAGTTFNNMAAAKKSLYTEAVIPNMNLWLNKFCNWILPDYNKADNTEYSIEMDLASIPVLQEDQREEAEKDKIISDTIINVLTSTISRESKISTLVYSIGMSEEEAEMLVGTEITE